MQTEIPCVMMRGGTSRGAYFQASDLPADSTIRDQVLLAVMGSPDCRQIDGIGGATTLTSRVAIVSPSSHPDADVDFLFALVCVDRPFVDTAPSCGNMVAGVGPFAIENELVEPGDGATLVRVHNLNTDSLIDVVVQTPNYRVRYDGNTVIDGVPGMAAPVTLNFRKIVGSNTGKLLPTGNVVDIVEGVKVSCIDVAMPVVLIAASAVGTSGYETKYELDRDHALLERLESVRLAAARCMGLGNASGRVIPKIALLARPRDGGNITSRYFVPTVCHAAHAVTGAICLAVGTALSGSVAGDLAQHDIHPPRNCVIEHPSGRIEVALDLTAAGDQLQVNSAGVVRTARKLFAGQVYIPASVWQP